MGVPDLLLLLSSAHLVFSGMDPSVCTSPTPVPSSNQSSIPPLPPSFEVHVECNFLELNATVEVHEFYDDSTNQGLVRMRTNNIPIWAYYSYNTNELLAVNPITKKCTVDDLQKTATRYLFGYQLQNGKGHIFSATGALHFAEEGVVEVYQGHSLVRGMNVVSWRSCMYWPDMDATMIVTWYFTAPLEWNTALNILQVPVRAHAKGRRYVKGVGHDFEHYYEFLHFRPWITDTHIFETPVGVSCSGRKKTRNLPGVAPSYSMNVEIVDQSLNKITFMKEYYDDEMKLTKFQYKPAKNAPSPYGYNPLIEVHDFNTGVAYVMDPLIGNCSCKPIEQAMFDDVTSKNPHYVRMRTSKQFFYLDSSDVTYEGVKTVRNIACDSWVGRRTHFEGFIVNTTWQWCFQKSNWTADQQRFSQYKMATPLMLGIDMSQLGLSYEYNVYNFIQSRPNLLDFDISPCFENLPRRKFDFQIPNDNDTRLVISLDKEMFKMSALMAISSYTDVFPLRISRLRIIYDAHIHVRFELLGVRPIKGDVVTNTTQTPLDVAAQNLVSAVKNNRFVITVMMPGVSRQNSPYVVALPDSLQEYTYEWEVADYTGYTPGALGGLSVGMIVVGGFLGVGASYRFFK